MSMICPYHNCLDNVRGECFGGGCSRMPEIGRECNEPEEEDEEEKEEEQNDSKSN